MTLGFLFWLIFVLAVVLGLYTNRGAFASGAYGILGGSLVVLILLFILGWRVFGFVIQN
jgi:hypothetical protein